MFLCESSPSVCVCLCLGVRCTLTCAAAAYTVVGSWCSYAFMRIHEWYTGPGTHTHSEWANPHFATFRRAPHIYEYVYIDEQQWTDAYGIMACALRGCVRRLFEKQINENFPYELIYMRMNSARMFYSWERHDDDDDEDDEYIFIYVVPGCWLLVAQHNLNSILNGSTSMWLCTSESLSVDMRLISVRGLFAESRTAHPARGVVNCYLTCFSIGYINYSVLYLFESSTPITSIAPELSGSRTNLKSTKSIDLYRQRGALTIIIAFESFCHVRIVNKFPGDRDSTGATPHTPHPSLFVSRRFFFFFFQKVTKVHSLLEK